MGVKCVWSGGNGFEAPICPSPACPKPAQNWRVDLPEAVFNSGDTWTPCLGGGLCFLPTSLERGRLQLHYIQHEAMPMTWTQCSTSHLACTFWEEWSSCSVLATQIVACQECFFLDVALSLFELHESRVFFQSSLVFGQLIEEPSTITVVCGIGCFADTGKCTKPWQAI